MSSPCDYGLDHDEWRPHQRESVEWVLNRSVEKTKLVEAPTGCHRKGQLIMMSDGSLKAVEDIQAGDCLMGPDYQPRVVQSLCRGTGQMYEIIPASGKSFVVNEDHVLTLFFCVHGVLDISVREYLLQHPSWIKIGTHVTERIGLANNIHMDWTPQSHLIRSYSNGKVKFCALKVKDLQITENYYGFTLTGDGRYLLDDFTVTHNSGKTALACAVSSRAKTIALVRTKSLQIQYRDIYSFSSVFGKGNYPCIHDDAGPNATAEDCLYDDSPRKCPAVGRCLYHVLKWKAIASDRSVLNYSYFLTSGWPRESSAQYLFLDECHQLSEQVLDFAGVTVTDNQISEWSLPRPPEIEGEADPLWGDADPIDSAIEWLGEAVRTLDSRIFKLQQSPDDPEKVDLCRKATRLHTNLQNTVEAIYHNPKDWFIRSGATARTWGGRNVPGFLCRPLTARHHFPKLFLKDTRTTVLMSATVGDPEAFTRELGIEKGKYLFIAIPNQWPPETRPVYILDAPAMGYTAAKKDPGIYGKRAEVIAKAIKGVDPSWSGVVHVTKKSDAVDLAKRLSALGLQDRVWVPRIGSGTNQQLVDWESYKRKVPNALAITWTWHEGVNLTGESICCLAKIPFCDTNDPYEKKRLQYDRYFYMQRAAWQAEQALGRTRRGEEEDYDVDGERSQLVCIADSNLSRIKKYLSESLRQALVEKGC